MQASEKGIDVGGRVLDMLLAFAGETEEQNRVFFRVKGRRVRAAATAKNRAIEVEGKAEGAEDGEWPVEGAFLRKLAKTTENGSKHVPTVVARLLCQRTGVSAADLVVQASGKKIDTLQHHGEMPANTQLSFATIAKTIAPNFEVPGSWFPIDKKLHAALAPVYAAVGKGHPISLVGGKDEQSPVAFQAKGEDFVVRGILLPPEVQGPGREAVDQDDDDEGGDDEKQPGLFEGKATGTDDDTVIEDAEAERIQREQNFVEHGDADGGKKRRGKGSKGRRGR